MRSTIKKQKNETRLSKKYLWSFFLVVFIIDILITVLLFAFYSGVQTSTTKTYSVAQLDQVCTATDILYKSMESVSNQIISDRDTFSFINSQEIDRCQETKACLKLKSIKSANSYIRYVNIYNASTKRLISNSCVGTDEDLSPEFFYSILGNKRYACYVRPIGEQYSLQKTKTKYVYTFVFRMMIKPDAPPDLVIIDVEDSYFRDVFASLRTTEKEQQIFLADQLGSIITSRVASEGERNFVSDFAYSDLPVSIAKNQLEPSGSISYIDNMHTRKFVTYSTAKLANWTIINVLPYSAIINGLAPIALLTGLLAIVTLAFGYLISKKMSSVLYAPIGKLYQNYVSADTTNKKKNELERLSDVFSEMYKKADRLEQGLISSYNNSKNIYLNYLIHGEIDKVNHSSSIYERLNINLEFGFYTTILMECVPQNVVLSENGSEQSKSTLDANMFIPLYALENISTEVISAYCDMDLLRNGENLFTIFLYLEENRFPDGLLEALNTIPTVMLREFSMETTLCVGNIVDSWQSINMCYEQSKIALSSRSFIHHGKVFMSSEKKDTMSVDQYFNGLHNKIAEYIRNRDINACINEFDFALSSMVNISFKTAKSYFKHVTMSVLDDFSFSFDRTDDSFGLLINDLDSIDNCQNIKSLKNTTITFLTNIIRRIELNSKNGNQDAAEKVKDYINKNYANPDISLRMLADVIGLSPAYLGKIFTSVTASTFNDYINSVRLSKAAKMLTESKRSITEISEAVGILNTNYFYSIFKKKYGTTPSAYRKEIKNNEKSVE